MRECSSKSVACGRPHRLFQIAELWVALRGTLHLRVRWAGTCLKEPGNERPYRHASASSFRRAYDEETDFNPSIPPWLRGLCVGDHAGDRPAAFGGCGLIRAVFDLVVDFGRLHQAREPTVKALLR